MNNTPNRLVIILSGVSGAGKSFFADFLKIKNPQTTAILSADDYFIKNGEYKFDASKLKQAHEQCKANFLLALCDGALETIIISNTNTSKWEYQEYKENAEKAGWNVIRLIVDHNLHRFKDIHGVPSEVKESQKERILNSLK